MSLGAISPSPLVDQAVRRLREQISEGVWPVGTKLPGETTLAEQLGVGRSTVREALRALTGAGLLRPRQGVGVFVIATEPAQDLSDWLREATVNDVYEVRMLIEVQAARLAAQRRDEADVSALRAALAARRAAVDADDGAFVDADLALHRAAVAAAHNPVLTNLFGAFVPILRQGLIDLVDLLDLRTAQPNPGDASHADLVRSIENGDDAAAGRILQTELEETVALLNRARGSAGSGA
jgi:GntR family transcriptional repressor for pyruvate dehydrogenase complex